MTGVNEKLLSELPEEMNGAVAYHQLAIEMKSNGCEECAFVMEIAIDEMTHAEWIHDYLHKHGVEIPENVEKRYNELKMAHKK